MENIMTMTTSTTSNPCQTSDFGMPTRGRRANIAGEQRFPTTGLSITGPIARDLRDRKDLAAKGHVALVAYVPGIHAWSPPLC
ncbi:hypothetical protein FE634_07720 [Nocardioides dongxiaopingii]|jgi:hypothetical protein|uniref:hypothetical protein n=1 Tax=Nocardioides sp. S-1144 TaxID=2582905 RepID=UPI00110DB51A|nr:hypothetical protein [Nocardioides sp. S-1144]QCW50323.1 hypothetical protein FE634_07720 [Nocardioides sp. S-1144]